MNLHRIKKQQGLTIVEILIAITLSTILLTGVIQIFASTSQSYRVQDGLSRIQENGRFGVSMITRDAQMAGFYGCNDGSSFTNKLNSTTQLQYQYAIPVAGYDDVSATTPTMLSNAGITPDAGTDVIIIRRTEGEPYRLASPTTSDSLVMEATSVINNFCSGSADQVNGFCPGDIMMVTDCSKSIIFQSGLITASGTAPDEIATVTHPTSGTPGNADASWGGESSDLFTDDANSVVYRMSTIVYYVRTVSGMPTLFRYANGTSSALIDGIEDMQIQYGEDTTGDGITNQYINAFNYTIADQDRWRSIAGIKVRLLARSINNNLTEEKLSYTFNGDTTAAADMDDSDRYVRREFATTITLRNQSS